SLALGAVLGPWAFVAAIIGVALAWAYSAPPLRLKRDGWWGPAIVGLSYEGLAWFTGAAVVLGALPNGMILTLAALYSIGAHGIMTLNDFKAIEGDTRFGVNSLPVTLGAPKAAKIACLVMAVPQVIVVGLLVAWDRPVHGLIVAVLLAVQFRLMAVLLKAPRVPRR
ncbi:MAG: UbiA family prenyltransferase, partial [Pseudomonadota bacterium]